MYSKFSVAIDIVCQFRQNKMFNKHSLAEFCSDSDDEEDIWDETMTINRYLYQLSSALHFHLSQQNLTSEDDDDEELHFRTHHEIMDLMNRISFDYKESLTDVSEAEKERTLSPLIAEQEGLEHQLSDIDDDDLLLGSNDESESEGGTIIGN
ncbi:unnamed protein product [Rotaria sp. Silwood1]|nr:unnamed protein product [Rotaria sp. Silwood1]